VDGIFPAEDVDTFVSGWQIFLFECRECHILHVVQALILRWYLVLPDNIVREALKQRIVHQTSTSPDHSTSSSASAPAPIGAHANSLADLHMHATHKCRLLLPAVLLIFKRHLQNPSSTLIRADTGLIRDGCAFAGFMLAHGDLEGDSNGESLQSVMSLEEGTEVCIRTLNGMRWSFSDSAKTKQTLIDAWDARKARDRERRGRQEGRVGQHYGMRSVPSHRRSSQVQPYGQPFAGYASPSSYTPGQNYETQPWIHPGSSGNPGAQHMQNIDPNNPNSTFSPEEWFGYNPTH
jgi:hypothetical protein